MSTPQKLHSDCPAGPGCPPNDPELHVLWHEGEFQECETRVRSVLEKCPNCAKANLWLIGCFAALRLWVNADDLVERLLPSANGDLQLAELCAAKGRILQACVGPRQATPWLQLAAELHREPGYMSRLAQTMWAQRRKEIAADLAEQAVGLKPFDPAVIQRCITMLVRAGRLEAAREGLLALAGRDYEIPHYHVAVAAGLVFVGLPRQGLALAKRAAKAHPESIGTACTVSQLLLDAGKSKAAVPLLRRTLKLDPAGHGKFALMNLALIAAESGDIERMLRTSVQANLEFNDAETRRLLRTTFKIVSLQVREREAALKKLAGEHARVTSQHEALEESLAGYDLSEGGTNLEFALRDGEGWHIEFKECMPDQARDLAIEVAALSSQGGGGTIFLGVRDNGDILGIGGVETVKDRDQWRHRIAQIATRVVQPPNPVTVYFNERDGLGLIKIWVPEGSAPIYYVDHIAYIRNLDESRKATPEEIEEYIARRSSTGGRNGS